MTEQESVRHTVVYFTTGDGVGQGSFLSDEMIGGKNCNTYLTVTLQDCVIEYTKKHHYGSNHMGKLKVRQGNTIEMRPVAWLWQGRIPRNKVTLIQGDGGEGKSSFTLFLEAGLSVGKAPPSFLDEEAPELEPMNVFYVSTEDESEDTALPRFVRFGGDINRYFDNDEKECHFELTEECFEEVYEVCHPGIMIIDPYQSFLPDGLHLGTVGEMRRIIAMMTRFAARHKVTILLIGHLNKNENSKDIHRGYGSGDIAAAMRNILKIEIDKKDETVRTLKVIKSNLDGACYDPVGIRLDDENRVELFDPREGEKSVYQIDMAVNIIRSNLVDGKAIQAIVEDEMEKSGIPDWTARRAIRRMGMEKTEIDGVKYLQIKTKK